MLMHNPVFKKSVNIVIPYSLYSLKSIVMQYFSNDTTWAKRGEITDKNKVSQPFQSYTYKEHTENKRLFDIKY